MGAHGGPNAASWLQSSVVNVAPVLPLQTNRTIAELTLLVVTNTATDANPGQTLTYKPVGFPTGATLDTTGIIRWTPTEAQGPSTNVLRTVVTDNGSPAMSATNEFTVIVTEANSAPALGGPTSINNTNPAAVSVPYTATDGDLPATRSGSPWFPARRG